MERRVVKAVVAGVLWAGAVLAGAAPLARANEPEPSHRFGIGYKIGNGVGFMGADVIVRAIPHLSFDLQANYIHIGMTNGTARGYALAPTAQLELRSAGSTPYLGLGLVYLNMTMGDVTASGTGALVNLGYQWKFASGLGILVGGGFNYLADVRATNGVDTIEREGGILPNIEAGLRYFF